MNDNFLTYLIICFALSFLIGVERQYRRRTIGLRTSILVSIGSFLFVTFTFSVGATDVSRIASQVVAGISFLGAGVILKDGTKVKGLTTAATLWCDAAIGVLCASGMIIQAAYGTIIILFSNVILRYLNVLIEQSVNDKKLVNYYNLNITLNINEISKIKKVIEDYSIDNKNNIEFDQLLIKKDMNTAYILCKIGVVKKNIKYLYDIVDKLIQNNDVNSVDYDAIIESSNDDEIL